MGTILPVARARINRIDREGCFEKTGWTASSRARPPFMPCRASMNHQPVPRAAANVLLTPAAAALSAAPMEAHAQAGSETASAVRFGDCGGGTRARKAPESRLDANTTHELPPPFELRYNFGLFPDPQHEFSFPTNTPPHEVQACVFLFRHDVHWRFQRTVLLFPCLRMVLLAALQSRRAGQYS